MQNGMAPNPAGTRRLRADHPILTGLQGPLLNHLPGPGSLP
jgi:hypothetical protein